MGEHGVPLGVALKAQASAPSLTDLYGEAELGQLLGLGLGWGQGQGQGQD